MRLMCGVETIRAHQRILTTENPAYDASIFPSWPRFQSAG
jgi:hypothetical protein